MGATSPRKPKAIEDFRGPYTTKIIDAYQAKDDTALREAIETATYTEKGKILLAKIAGKSGIPYQTYELIHRKIDNWSKPRYE